MPFEPSDGVFTMRVSAVILFRLISASLNFNFCFVIIFKQSTHQQHKKRKPETESSTADGECCSKPIMAYLRWEFPPFFGSVHYLLTFIFISVRYLFSNRELIKIKKRITSETETATAEGKCGSDFLMVYLPWAFLPFYCSVHSVLKFIFIFVRRLFVSFPLFLYYDISVTCIHRNLHNITTKHQKQ